MTVQLVKAFDHEPSFGGGSERAYIWSFLFFKIRESNSEQETKLESLLKIRV